MWFQLRIALVLLVVHHNAHAQIKEPVIDDDADEYCRICIQKRNGVGYYEDEDDCRRYFHCALDAYKEVIAYRMECAPGTLWEQSVAACVPCNHPGATCSSGRAELPIGVPRCPATTPYIPQTTTTLYPPTRPNLGRSCSGHGGWTYYEINEPNSENQFFREIQLGDDIARLERVSCGPAWLFDINICACMTPKRHALSWIKFDEFPFQDSIENVWVDSTGVGIGPGRFGQAAYFNGTGHIEIPRFNNYPWGSQISMSFWFNVDDTNNRKKGLVNNGDCVATPTIQFTLQNNRLAGQVLVINPNATADEDEEEYLTLQTVLFDIPDIRAGQWHHVVLTYDGLKVRIYLDNQLREDQIAIGAIPAALNPLTIGRDLHCEAEEELNAPTNVVGSVDDFQVYERPLNPNEVAILSRDSVDLEAETGYFTIGKKKK